MVSVYFDPAFEKAVGKIKNEETKQRLKKQIAKIIADPKIGKPMRYDRKGTREIYVAPLRLSYSYVEDKIIFLELYHKDEQ
jgi:mRNA-degrading endonuclease RelE of RelBE toxin-antitoxin system